MVSNDINIQQRPMNEDVGNYRSTKDRQQQEKAIPYSVKPMKGHERKNLKTIQKRKTTTSVITY